MSFLSSPRRGRSTDIDIIKGMLVFVMLTYHCASVTEGAGAWPVIRWIPQQIAFIHFAFLILSGFLCGWHYYPKLASDERGARERLIARGVKLIALTFILNVALYMSGFGYRIDKLISATNSLSGFLGNVVLNVKGDLVAFEILYYIGLFLVAASLLLGRTNLIVLALLTVALSLAGKTFNVLHFLSYGFLGFLAGMLTVHGHFSYFWSFMERTRGLAVAFIFVGYQMLAPHIHGIAGAWLLWFVYSFESGLWFLFFIFLFRTFSHENIVSRLIMVVGRYTLAAYIAQMLLVRLGFFLLSKLGMEGWNYYIANWVICSTILTATIVIGDHLRTRSHIINRTYKLVFE